VLSPPSPTVSLRQISPERYQQRRLQKRIHSGSSEKESTQLIAAQISNVAAAADAASQ
jgi:hypothetical protein